MNYIKAVIIPLLFSGFILCSCEKDKTVPDEKNPLEITNTMYLKSVNNNNEYTNYTYDSINQLVKIENGPDDRMTMEFYYNNSNQITSMIITDTEGVSETSYQYTSDGVLTSSSTNNGQGEFTYEYADKKLVKVYMYGNIPNIGQTLMGRTEFDYEGENISEFREYYKNPFTGNFSLTDRVTYEHDSKKNPFCELKIANCIINLGHEQFASKNNCINRTVVESSYGDPIGSFKLQFDYNSNAYPTSASDGTTYSYN